MKSRIQWTIISLLIIFSFFVVQITFAQSLRADIPVKTNISDQLTIAGSISGPYSVAAGSSMANIAGTVVTVALSILGIIFIILMIYAGYNWMTAGGNEEQVTKAKDTIKKAIIGLIIISSAYLIWYFISINILGLT